MAALNIDDYPEDLRRRVKVVAMMADKTLRGAMIEAAGMWLDFHDPDRANVEARKTEEPAP